MAEFPDIACGQEYNLSESAIGGDFRPGKEFSHAFQQEIDQPAAEALEDPRVEAARMMMERTRPAFAVIAAETGFIDHERLRAFLRAFGQSPQKVKRNV